MSLLIKENNKRGFSELQTNGCFDGARIESKTRRGRVIENGSIAPTITTDNQILVYHGNNRKIHPNNNVQHDK